MQRIAPSKKDSDVPFVKTPGMHRKLFVLGTTDCLSTKTENLVCPTE
jgi:hypothetical protein